MGMALGRAKPHAKLFTNHVAPGLLGASAGRPPMVLGTNSVNIVRSSEVVTSCRSGTRLLDSGPRAHATSMMILINNDARPRSVMTGTSSTVVRTGGLLLRTRLLRG